MSYVYDTPILRFLHSFFVFVLRLLIYNPFPQGSATDLSVFTLFVFFIMVFLVDKPQILRKLCILILEQVINFNVIKFNDDYCLFFVKIIY